jgi:hypothetical protein
MPVTHRKTLISLDDLTLAIGTLSLLIEQTEADDAESLEALAIRVVARLVRTVERTYA